MSRSRAVTIRHSRSIQATRPERHRGSSSKFPQVFLSLTILVGVVVVLCGYGYAAVNADLQISGEATIKQTGGTFTSTYMQDVTAAECANVENDTEAQLIDKRDGKKYWVIKLRDGSCWMTQDLKYDIVANEDGKIELTSELTDINPDNVEDYYEYRLDANGNRIWLWNENSRLPPTETYIDVKGNTTQNQNTTYSWNRGSWVMSEPTNANSKGHYYITWKDLEGNEYAYTPSDSLPAGVGYDSETWTYNPHYLSGNYYQYNAASAGGRVTGGNPISSICPKGWTLPHTSATGSILASAKSLYSTSELKSVYSWPLYLGRNGYHLNGNVNMGSANYWGGWFVSDTNISALGADSSGTWLTSTSKNSQSLGLTVRCQVRGAGS